MSDHLPTRVDLLIDYSDDYLNGLTPNPQHRRRTRLTLATENHGGVEPQDAPGLTSPCHAGAPVHSAATSISHMLAV